MDFFAEKVRRMLRHSALIIFFVSCALSFTFACWAHSHPLLKALPAEQKIHDVVYWQTIIRNKGVENAVQLMKSVGLSLLPSDAHTVAHIFGHALFLEFGSAGLKYCGSDFSYGCIHDFATRYVSADGTRGVDSLIAYCKSGSLPGSIALAACAHGVGHAVTVLEGYANDDIQKSFKLCEGELSEKLAFSCKMGALMEWNLRTSIDNAPPRTVLNRNLLWPCDTMNVSDEEVCIASLPQFLRISYFGNMSSHAAFREIGSICSSLIDKAFVSVCFSGIGNFVNGEFNTNYAQRALLCDATSENVQYRMLCREHAAVTLPKNERRNAISIYCALGPLSQSCMYTVNAQRHLLELGDERASFIGMHKTSSALLRGSTGRAAYMSA